MGKAFKYLAECLLLSSKMYWHCKQDVKKAKKASSDCDRMKFREIIPREMKRMCNSEGEKNINKIARAAVMFAGKWPNKLL